jgi:hypothetical protein
MRKQRAAELGPPFRSLMHRGLAGAQEHGPRLSEAALIATRSDFFLTAVALLV